MSKKQDMFGLPIFFNNESKNEDCLEIMDKYEEQLEDIFREAYGNFVIITSYCLLDSTLK